MSNYNLNSGTNHLTIGDTTYKTGGNILFSGEGQDGYLVAKSHLLDKMDKAIQNGIAENGMQTFIKKLRG
ncbi:MAG: hypothetical protein PHH14_03740 [Candidatus Margulisbacteria bacterium]|nr:hypothetical protein [Candidatus Margulisiibacteriota bacterium]